ncbi:hypothetical protein [Flavobacterium sp.]|uniref:hypothetical protein n=1 Tax=Flavobacterium sp. TaxID=239 RepID=UPI0011F480E9|nr:hypothetical protein [Flavobacterium sp.]RZJ70283.1 MAG: hypothetical protein EOO49_14225 [Flavobacterium sp.]
MNPTTAVRFFSGENPEEVSNLIDAYLRQNLDWEISSVSHMLVGNGVSVACSLKFFGDPNDGKDALNDDF